MNINIPEPTMQALRWTQSPLNRAMTEVERAVASYKDVRIGANNGTRVKVIAANHLGEILAEIRDGRRDGMGYPL